MTEDDKLAIYRNLTGASFAVAFERDTRIRGVWIDDIYYISLVDFMSVWGEPEATARRSAAKTGSKLWNDEKKRLIRKNPEFSEMFGKLKLRGADGKMYPSEVATTETAILILLYMETPASNQFKALAAKLLDHIGRPEWAYRKLYAEIAASGSVNPIWDFLHSLDLLTFYPDEDDENGG